MLAESTSKLLQVTLTSARRDSCKRKLSPEESQLWTGPGPPLRTKRSRKKCMRKNATTRFLRNVLVVARRNYGYTYCPLVVEALSP